MGSNSFSMTSWKNSFCSPPSSTPSSPSNSTLSCFRRSIGFRSEIASSCEEGENAGTESHCMHYQLKLGIESYYIHCRLKLAIVDWEYGTCTHMITSLLQAQPTNCSNSIACYTQVEIKYNVICSLE